MLRSALSRLRKLLPRGRAFRWILLLLLLLPPLLLGLALLAASFFRVELRIDLAMMLFACAATLGGLTLFHLVRHWARPERSVSINYDFRLIQPALPLGRYLFRLAITYEVEHKGQTQSIKQGSIELRFRRSDHPELLEWCKHQIAGQLDRHRRLAQERFPNARILTSPELTETQFRRRLEVARVS